MGSKESTPVVVDNAEDGMVQPLYQNGRYKNPFDTFHEPGYGNLFKFLFATKDESDIPWKDKKELDRTLPVIDPPDYNRLNNPPQDKVQLMWVGHATVLVQFDGIAVLTDPIWGDRCGPLGIGPKRFRNPPCKIDNLPNIDAVVISHNHYDHLNHESVVKLNQRFGDTLRWFVPKGQGSWMEDNGCKNVTELSWWEESEITKDGKSYMFASTPAQHWCKRTATDTNKALWCSWVVKGPKHNFYFAGDTGYCFGFKQIGHKYGPFSLAAIPIGAYEPRFFMKPQHVNPEEAVMIHQDIRAQKSVGIHWGTFRLTTEFYMEPKHKLAEVLAEKGLDPNCFFTVKHGDVVTADEVEKLKRTVTV